MKFTADAEQLGALVARAASATGSSNAPIVTHYLKLEAGEGRMGLFGTDLDRQQGCFLNAGEGTDGDHLRYRVEQAGSLLVEAGFLAAALKGARGEAGFALEDGQAVVSVGRGTYRGPKLDSADFPVMDAPEPDPETLISMTGEELHRLMSPCLSAMSRDETRYYLCGIHICHEEGRGLTFVSTDGHKLARSQSGEYRLAAASVILPEVAVKHLLRSVPKNETALTIQPGEGRWSFAWGDNLYTTKLIDGTFPDYARVIPAGNEFSVVIEAAKLKEVAGRLRLFAKDKTSSGRFSFENDTMVISGGSHEVGTFRESLACQCAGTGPEIGFNLAYVEQILGIYGTEDVELRLGDGGSSPINIRPVDRDGVEHVLMPLRA